MKNVLLFPGFILANFTGGKTKAYNHTIFNGSMLKKEVK